ncbi:hypothetical protein V1280_008043 [Bradyrhizobium sp. AZCC 2230]
MKSETVWDIVECSRFPDLTIKNNALPAMFLLGGSALWNDHPFVRLIHHTPAEWRNKMLNQGELDRGEMGRLIGSDKVEGTSVYGADRNKIGSIERVMIDKVSGKVSYAVLGFGGFLGLGNDHYPLPWQSLKYDTELGGYVAGITAKSLEGAPRYGERSDWNWGDDAAVRGINSYYGVPFA